MPLLDVDNIASHADLEKKAGGAQLLSELLPEAWDGDSSVVRASAYEEIVNSLARREPPIREADLSNPAELKFAVINGALSELYNLASTSAGDKFSEMSKFYEKRFQNDLASLSPTVHGGGRVPVGTISIERR